LSSPLSVTRPARFPPRELAGDAASAQDFQRSVERLPLDAAARQHAQLALGDQGAFDASGHHDGVRAELADHDAVGSDGEFPGAGQRPLERTLDVHRAGQFESALEMCLTGDDGRGFRIAFPEHWWLSVL